MSADLPGRDRVIGDLPWSIANHDGRISILDANGYRVSEIYPGQVLGRVPTVADAIGIAERIVDAVNRFVP